MIRTHHAVTANGRMSLEITETPEDARDLIASMLSRMDGTNNYSLVLWAMPQGKRLDEVDEDTWPVEYIQCAGSSEAMTIEIRRMENGEAAQYVVGRASEERAGEPAVAIPWDAYVATVYQDEVFNAEEATELFAYYLVDGAVPPEFSLRHLDLSFDNS